MTLITLALILAPVTLPLTARIALGKDCEDVFVGGLLFGTILAVLGIMRAVDPA